VSVLTSAAKTAPTLKSPTAIEAPIVPSTPTGQQAGANDNGDPAPQTQVQAPKPPAKPTIESAPQAPEPTTNKAEQPLPQAAAPALPTVALPTVTEPNTSPVPAKAAPAPETTAQPTDSRPAAAALPETHSTAKSEPVRDLSIRIGDSPGTQVDVKIRERAGEIHVAVLSSSPSLTTNLREQVGDLVGKLDRAGYHAETFKSPSTTASQQSSNQSDSGQQDSSGGNRQQQQQEDARQQFLGRQKRSNQTQWVQQMNGGLDPAAAEGIEKQ
jgi:hypothetical protein